MGLNRLFAGLGVFVRDLAQIMGSLVRLMMFLGPIFYPRSAMPEAMRPWLALNPITVPLEQARLVRSEEHTSELQSLMRISYAVFCLKKKNNSKTCATHHSYISYYIPTHSRPITYDHDEQNKKEQ